jgi:hypothetical protein
MTAEKEGLFSNDFIKSQIREKICLEKHFQYEFSILGRFGQTGLQRKKGQTAISMQRTFDASFFM